VGTSRADRCRLRDGYLPISLGTYQIHVRSSCRPTIGSRALSPACWCPRFSFRRCSVSVAEFACARFKEPSAKKANVTCHRSLRFVASRAGMTYAAASSNTLCDDAGMRRTCLSAFAPISAFGRAPPPRSRRGRYASCRCEMFDHCFNPSATRVEQGCRETVFEFAGASWR
jgi:hypothetical protein